MNKIDRYKILIRYMVSAGIIASQRELCAKMGYANETTLSQIINAKVKEPKDFVERLSAFVPELNKTWLETGEGVMLHEQNENNGGGQHFHGDINGNNPQFSGRDTINNPCEMGAEFKTFIAALTAQADLTKQAHELTRNAQAQVDKAQAQMDRLITMLEQKLNIVTV